MMVKATVLRSFPMMRTSSLSKGEGFMGSGAHTEGECTM